jgi:hypothetical protein
LKKGEPPRAHARGIFVDLKVEDKLRLPCNSIGDNNMPLQVIQIVGNSFIIVGGPKVPVVGLLTDGGNPKHA